MTCINTGRLKDAELLLQTLPLSQLYQDLQKLQKVTSDVIQPHVLSQLSRSLSLLQTKQQQLCTHLKTSATAYENMESSLSSKAKAISDHLQYQIYTMDHSMRWHTSFRKDKSLFSYLKNGVCAGIYAGLDVVKFSVGFHETYAQGNLSTSVGSASVSGDAKFSLYDNQGFSPSLTVSLVAKAALAQAVADIHLGNSYVYADGEASVGVGVVKAEGTAVLNKEELTLKGEVGAAAVQGEVKGSITILGVSITATGTGELGAIGAGAEFSSKKGEFSFGAKGSLLAGLGFRVKVNY